MTTTNRWPIAIAGVFMQVALGAVCAASAQAGPTLRALHWYHEAMDRLKTTQEKPLDDSDHRARLLCGFTFRRPCKGDIYHAFYSECLALLQNA